MQYGDDSPSPMPPKTWVPHNTRFEIFNSYDERTFTLSRLLANLPIIIFFAVFVAMAAILYALQKNRQSRGFRSQAAQNLFRIPNQSMLRQLDRLNLEINFHLVFIFLLPLITYATILSHWVFKGVRPNEILISILSILCLSFWGYCIFKIAKLISHRRDVKLGYEGKVAVRQEINQLVFEDYRVYHDFPADGFKIDHIIVGSNGVFTVETKTYPKVKSKKNTSGATVSYDGRGLHFPKATDFDTLELAERQAAWLSEWLTRTAGEPLAVRAIVALPGWFVKRTSSDGIPVVNPNQFSSLFEHIKPRPLSESMLNRIDYQIKEKCRAVEQPSNKIETGAATEEAFTY